MARWALPLLSTFFFHPLLSSLFLPVLYLSTVLRLAYSKGTNPFRAPSSYPRSINQIERGEGDTKTPLPLDPATTSPRWTLLPFLATFRKFLCKRFDEPVKEMKKSFAFFVSGLFFFSLTKGKAEEVRASVRGRGPRPQGRPVGSLILLSLLSLSLSLFLSFSLRESLSFPCQRSLTGLFNFALFFTYAAETAKVRCPGSLPPPAASSSSRNSGGAAPRARLRDDAPEEKSGSRGRGRAGTRRRLPSLLRPPASGPRRRQQRRPSPS